jgi:hypothetical protein
MGNINTARLLLSALIAGIFYFFADFLVHGVLLSADHLAAVNATGKQPTEHWSNYLFFFLFDLGKGLVVMLICVFARARLSPGVQTAVIAGLIGWLAIEVLPALSNMPFPFYPKMVYAKWIAFELVPMMAGAVLGAWLYKET